MSFQGFRAATICALAIAAAGCASTPPSAELAADRSLCAEATAQARRGDPNWSATLNRMKSLQELQNCNQNINQYVFGSMNGGG